MLFRGRYDRQINRIKEKRQDVPLAFETEDVQNVIEKGDVPAMIISALLVIVPAALIFLVVLSAIGFFFIVR